MAGSFVVLPAATLPLAVWTGGRGAWLIMGFAFASAFWLDVIIVLVGSGSINAFAGLMAETDSAEELQRLRRRGWRIVNGLVLRGDEDIDHIAVGPAGVLVVETKHADDRWPLGTAGSAYMVKRLDDVKDQARRNARDVGRHEAFRRAIGGAPVRAVLVLASASGGADASPHWIDEGDLTLVRARHLRRWLETLDGNVLDRDRVSTIWAELERHAERRDRQAEKRDGPPKLTMSQLLTRTLVETPVGFYAAFYASFTPLSRTLGGWSTFAVVAGLIAIGWQLRRQRRLRWFAYGWLAGCLTVVAVLVVVGVRIAVT